MKLATLILALSSFSFMSAASQAADYSQAIKSCKAQIEQEFAPNLKKQSLQNSRTKGAKKMILGFKVWLSDDAGQSSEKIRCTVLKNGEVLELRTL